MTILSNSPPFATFCSKSEFHSRPPSAPFGLRRICLSRSQRLDVDSRSLERLALRVRPSAESASAAPSGSMLTRALPSVSPSGFGLQPNLPQPLPAARCSLSSSPPGTPDTSTSADPRSPPAPAPLRQLIQVQPEITFISAQLPEDNNWIREAPFCTSRPAPISPTIPNRHLIDPRGRLEGSTRALDVPPA